MKTSISLNIKSQLSRTFSVSMIFLASLATTGSGYALSSTTSSKNDLHIALVDVQSAILQTNDSKLAREKIEKEMAKKRQDLLDQENQLKKMQEEIQAQMSVLSDSDKLNKQKEFQSKVMAFQQAQTSFQQEAQQKESAALQKIFQNIEQEIQKIAQEKNFDMVFDKSAAVLLYANNASDITSDVVTKYNNDYKGETKAKK